MSGGHAPRYAVDRTRDRTRDRARGGAPRRGFPPAPWAIRLPLAGRPGVVTECRDFTRAALADWPRLRPRPRPGHPVRPTRPARGTATLDEVVLLVSELVTNACRHAGGPLDLLLIRGAGALRVEVSDPSPVPPRPRPLDRPLRPGGLGLHLLARLALSWGWQRRERGKTVWFEVLAPSDRPPGGDGVDAPPDRTGA
ncbi:ATP-binding protein [Kitasatospora sp. NPDC054939]